MTVRIPCVPGIAEGWIPAFAGVTDPLTLTLSPREREPNG